MDEGTGFAYVTRHRGNTLNRVPLAPFRAGDLALPEAGRLAALELAFFAPGHDASIWLTGWYPQTLAMQHAAVATAGGHPDDEGSAR